MPSDTNSLQSRYFTLTKLGCTGTHNPLVAGSIPALPTRNSTTVTAKLDNLSSAVNERAVERIVGVIGAAVVNDAFAIGEEAVPLGLVGEQLAAAARDARL